MRRHPATKAKAADSLPSPLHRQPMTTEQSREPPPRVHGWFFFYRFLTTLDMALLVVGVAAAIASGALFAAALVVVVGRVVDASTDTNTASAVAAARLLAATACGTFVLDYATSLMLDYAAERQARRLRSEAFRRGIRSGVLWWDQRASQELTSQLSTTTMRAIESAMGQRLGVLVRTAAQSLVGMSLARWHARTVWWAVLIFPTSVFVGAAMLSTTFFAAVGTISKKQQAVADTDAATETALSQLRVIASLHVHDKVVATIAALRHRVEAAEIQSAILMEAVVGILAASLLATSPLLWWLVMKQVTAGTRTPTDVLQALTAFAVGVTASVKLLFTWCVFVEDAVSATRRLFKILDATPTMDGTTGCDGVRPDTCKDVIEFKGVHWHHPTDSDQLVLAGLDLCIATEETVALVTTDADSLSLSAIASLLLRVYDPPHGEISLDGKDMEDLSLRWLRKQIGVVSAARPFLLDGLSVFENLALGDETVTCDQAIAAAKRAGIHDYIMALPLQYDTRLMATAENDDAIPVLERQLLTLTRALARNPKILIVEDLSGDLIDHALAAITNKTTLLTTLLVTNRLSCRAIRFADKIVVLKNGHVVESGTHDDLLALPQGVFKSKYDLETPLDEDSASLPIEKEATATRTKCPPASIMDIVRLVPDALEWTRCISGACALVMAAVVSVAFATSKMVEISMTADRIQLRSKGIVGIHAWWFLSAIVFLVGSCVAEFATLTSLQTRLATRVRSLYLRALLHQPLHFFNHRDDHSPTALTAQLTTRSDAVASILDDDLALRLGAVSALVGALVVATMTLGSKAALTVLAVVSFFVGVQWRLMAHGRLGRNHTKPSFIASDAFVVHRLSHMQSIVAFGLEEETANAFDGLAHEPTRHSDKHTYAFLLALSESMFTVTWTTVLWTGVQHMALESSTQSALNNVVAVAAALTTALVITQICFLEIEDKDTVNTVESPTHAMAAILALHANAVEEDDDAGERPSSVQGKIAFCDVTWPADGSGLQHFSLTVEPGETLAVCSTSDDTASQLAALLERFTTPASGTVLLDGRDLETLSAPWLRDKLGVLGVILSPTLVLTPGTIAENIAYAMHRPPSQRKIEMAAWLVGVDDAISDLPEAYATNVMVDRDDGARVDDAPVYGIAIDDDVAYGVALARVMIRDPAILLVGDDDWHCMQETLRNDLVSTKRTTIVVTRRLSALRAADRVAVVHEGRVVELGTHTELLEKGELYRTLVVEEDEPDDEYRRFDTLFV